MNFLDNKTEIRQHVFKTEIRQHVFKTEIRQHVFKTSKFSSCLNESLYAGRCLF